MKRIIAVFVFFILVLSGMAYWYVSPEENLNMDYSPFVASEKIKEMIGSKHLEFHLSEADVNNLLKKELASRSLSNKNLEVTGAQFELNKDILIAHVNLRYQGLIPIGTVSYYQLSWDKPTIKAVPLYTQVRNWTLPKSWLPLPTQSVSLDSLLPTLLKVQDVNFEQKDILIRLRLS